MTPRQRLELRASQIRERLNELLGLEERTDEQRTEIRTLTGEAANVDLELRAAIVAEPEPEETPVETPDAEARELEELRSAFSVGRLLDTLSRRSAATGREAEYQAAMRADGTSIPLEVWEPAPEAETRAVTPAPTTTDRILRRPVVPALFDATVAPFLGIEMPRVGTGDAAYPVLSTSLTASVRQKGQAAPETAGAFTVKTAQPRRVTGAFQVQVEDTARFAGMEAALRRNLSDVLADKVDDRIINGAAAGADGVIAGLLAQLGNPNATTPASGAPTYAGYLEGLAGAIDGKAARAEGDISALVGVETLRKMAAEIAADRSMSASAAIRESFGGLMASGRIPGVADKKQAAIVSRRRVEAANASMPTWGTVTIRDIYSGAGEGEITITAFVLAGDVMLLRPDGYIKVEFRDAA